MISGSYNYPGIYVPPPASAGPAVAFVTGTVQTVDATSTMTGSVLPKRRIVQFLNAQPVVICGSLPTSLNLSGVLQTTFDDKPQPVYLTQPVTLSGATISVDSPSVSSYVTATFAGETQPVQISDPVTISGTVPVYVTNQSNVTVTSTQMTATFAGEAQPVYISGVLPVSVTNQRSGTQPVSITNVPLTVGFSGMAQPVTVQGVVQTIGQSSPAFITATFNGASQPVTITNPAVSVTSSFAGIPQPVYISGAVQIVGGGSGGGSSEAVTFVTATFAGDAQPVTISNPVTASFASPQPIYGDVTASISGVLPVSVVNQISTVSISNPVTSVTASFAAGAIFTSSFAGIAQPVNVTNPVDAVTINNPVTTVTASFNGIPQPVTGTVSANILGTVPVSVVNQISSSIAVTNVTASFAGIPQPVYLISGSIPSGDGTVVAPSFVTASFAGVSQPVTVSNQISSVSVSNPVTEMTASFAGIPQPVYISGTVQTVGASAPTFITATFAGEAQPVNVINPVHVITASFASPQSVTVTNPVSSVTVTNPVTSVTASIASGAVVTASFAGIAQPVSGAVSIIGTVPVEVQNQTSTVTVSNPTTFVTSSFGGIAQPISGEVSIIGTVPVTVQNQSDSSANFVTASFAGVSQPVTVSNQISSVSISNPVTTVTASFAPGAVVTASFAGVAQPVTGTISAKITDSAGDIIDARPDGSLQVALDPTTLLSDHFETLESTNTWALFGTSAPALSAGALSFGVGTTTNATSYARSIPVFAPQSSTYLQFECLVTLETAATTGNKRWWGLGTYATPSQTVPVTNGAIFEIDQVSGNLLASIYSNSTRTQSVTLTRPSDGLVHRYVIYYRASRAYFEIDSTTVATVLAPNTQVAVFNLVLGSVNGGTSPTATPTFLVAQAGLADTGKTTQKISDGNYPWRMATIKAAGAYPTNTDTALVTVASPVDSVKATYSAVLANFAPAQATPTDIFTIYGSLTKVVRVTKIEITATQTTAAVRDVILFKRSVINSGGTTVAVASQAYDSNNPAATATINYYTANPLTLGTGVGISARKLLVNTPTSATAIDRILWDWGNRPSQAIVLRGSNHGLAINLNSVASAGNSWNIFIEYTEE